MLPLLQLALNRLFEGRTAVANGAMLTVATYENLGGSPASSTAKPSAP